MKTIIAVLVLAVVIFGVFKYNEDLKRQERERLELAVSQCWLNVAPNSKAGADICKMMAKQLETKGH